MVLEPNSACYLLQDYFASLNPCSSGRWSRSYIQVSLSIDKPVLILVLVEDGLGDQSKGNS